MSGMDIDPHALAANIRNLTTNVETLRDESHERGEKLEAILLRLASNLERTNELSRRVSRMEEAVSALNAWKWKTAGGAALLILVAQWIFSR